MNSCKTAGLFDLLVRDDGSDPPQHHEWRVRVEQQYDQRRIEVALSLGLDATASWVEIMKLRQSLRRIDSSSVDSSRADSSHADSSPVDSNGAHVACIQRSDAGSGANTVCCGIGRSKMTQNLYHV